MKLTDRLIHLLGGITQEEARDREHRLVVSQNRLIEYYSNLSDQDCKTILELRERIHELGGEQP